MFEELCNLLDGIVQKHLPKDRPKKKQRGSNCKLYVQTVDFSMVEVAV